MEDVVTQLPLELSKPWKGWLHPELALVISDLLSLLDHLEKTLAEVPDERDLTPGQLKAMEWFERLPRHANGQVIIVPLVHPDLCDALLDYVCKHGENWTPNLQEDDAYRIPEIVLHEKIPLLYRSVRAFSVQILYPICKLFFGREPDRIDSIQLAKYTSEGTKSTGWHHDEDSTMTAVVNLAPERYKGGGTSVRTGLRTFEHVPSIPKGHALLFNGYQLLHKGCPVEEGERHLLVFWMTSGRG
ncbi:TPA: 2OG-Fe(II) oxygenase [Pseudomonas aeruginosa]|nr:2OG-Fe(II) oxygenase [Pseudomonas aeruginosa]